LLEWVEIKKIFSFDLEKIREKLTNIKAKIECYAISKELIERVLSGLKQIESSIAQTRSNIPEKLLNLLHIFSTFLEISIEYFFFFRKKLDLNSKTSEISENHEKTNGISSIIKDKSSSNEAKLLVPNNSIEKSSSPQTLDKYSPPKPKENPQYTLLNRSLAYQFVKNFEDFRLLQPKKIKSPNLNTSSVFSNGKTLNISMDQEVLIENIRRNQKDSETIKKELKEFEEKNAKLIWNEEREVF
jgi:hypothetical protein